MRTCEDVLEVGLYRNSCCDEELIFEIGDIFCRCPRCESLCRWELESKITPIEALETYPLFTTLAHPLYGVEKDGREYSPSYVGAA